MSYEQVFQAISFAVRMIELRDEFAKSAMQGLVARSFTVDEHDRPFVEWVSQLSYEFADDMLKARTARTPSATSMS